MKLQAFFTASLITSLVYAAPTKNIEITNNEFPEELVVYTAEYDIVNVLFPVNALNLKEETNNGNGTSSSRSPIIFFILADNDNGTIIYKGLYIRKNGEVTKLLDNGRDFAAANDDSETVYFAATDGLYFYNAKENKAEKYGTITDSVIGIAKFNGTEAFYILTENNMVWKVTEEGTKKEKVLEIDNALQIVIDYENKLYYTTNKNVYVFGSNGVTKIEGLPKNSDYIKLVRPPIVLKSGIPVIMDYEAYLINSNATTENNTKLISNFKNRPTAYSVDGTIILYMGYNKKIYEYNIIVMIFSAVFTKFRELITDFKNSFTNFVI